MVQCGFPRAGWQTPLPVSSNGVGRSHFRQRKNALYPFANRRDLTTFCGSSEGFMAEPTTAAPMPKTAPYSRRNPFLAEISKHELLTRPGSEKETRHFVIHLAGSGITYTPGDSL